VQRREHAETQQVELHETDRGAVVFVPLQHAAIFHAAPFDGADLDHRAIADDHAPRMDAEVARKVLDLECQLDHRGRHGVAALSIVEARTRGGFTALVAEAGPAIDRLGERVLLARGVTQGLGHVAHRRAGTVGDDIGDLCCMIAAVLVVDVLDGLFATIALDVDIDVGRAVSLG
jgi:hypothetical protein